MKIPRYDNKGISLQSNRSLTTGTAASNAVANLGKNVFDNKFWSNKENVP